MNRSMFSDGDWVIALPYGINVQLRPDRALTRKSMAGRTPQAEGQRTRTHAREQAWRPKPRDYGRRGHDAAGCEGVRGTAADRSSLALTSLTFRRGKGGPPAPV